MLVRSDAETRQEVGEAVRAFLDLCVRDPAIPADDRLAIEVMVDGQVPNIGQVVRCSIDPHDNLPSLRSKKNVF